MKREALKRFLLNVCPSDTGCWWWMGARTNSGYGQCSDGTRSTQAHRAAYEHFVGTIPKGLEVCHRCHNRDCVNPEHLYVDTHSNNMAESFRRRNMVQM